MSLFHALTIPAWSRNVKRLPPQFAGFAEIAHPNNTFSLTANSGARNALATASMLPFCIRHSFSKYGEGRMNSAARHSHRNSTEQSLLGGQLVAGLQVQRTSPSSVNEPLFQHVAMISARSSGLSASQIC